MFLCNRRIIKKPSNRKRAVFDGRQLESLVKKSSDHSKLYGFDLNWCVRRVNLTSVLQYLPPSIEYMDLSCFGSGLTDENVKLLPPNLKILYADRVDIESMSPSGFSVNRRKYQLTI